MFSFSKRKKAVAVYPYIRRICDLTAPNLPTAVTNRAENRSNRTIPTLLCPWENGHPATNKLAVCLTSNLSDRGIQLILTHPFSAESVVLGYWIASDGMREPWFFLGDVRRNKPIGGGFWAVGIELSEFANTDHRSSLAVLAEAAAKLAPPAVVPC